MNGRKSTLLERCVFLRPFEKRRGRLRHARDSKTRRCSRPAVPNNLMERVCVAVCSRGSLRQNSRRVGCTPHALHDSISKGRESQCSDRSHKPILVGATPTPASISTVNEASVSAQCRPEIATEVAATLKGLVVIKVSTAGLPLLRLCQVCSAPHDDALSRFSAAPSRRRSVTVRVHHFSKRSTSGIDEETVLKTAAPSTGVQSATASAIALHFCRGAHLA